MMYSLYSTPAVVCWQQPHHICLDGYHIDGADCCLIGIILGVTIAILPNIQLPNANPVEIVLWMSNVASTNTIMYYDDLTFLPADLLLATVEGLPMCWWLPPPWGCSTGYKHHSQCYHFTSLKKAKECASYLWKSISQLRSVTSTCRMGSHSVTCHSTQANTPRLYPSLTGWYSIYRPFKDGGLSKPRPRVQRATGPRLLHDSPGQRDPNTRSSER